MLSLLICLYFLVLIIVLVYYIIFLLPKYPIRQNHQMIRSIFNIKLSDNSSTYSFKLLPDGFPYKKLLLIRLLSITHKSIYYSTPSYIFDLLSIRSTTHDTRSTSSIHLVIPHPYFLKFQNLSLSYIIPSICNTPFIYKNH